MHSPRPKIFGIGLSKTGTTSLARALELLGYTVKDYPGISRYLPGDVTSVDLAVVDAHDALTDTPIPSFYRELDKQYPGSKFILTVRDSAGWLKSCKKQFTEPHAADQNDAHKQLFMDLYGTVVFDEEKFRAGYDCFVAGVMDYFKDRPGDLLVIDVTAGEGWEKLCPFLSKAVPEMPFPKANVTQITWLKVEDVVAIAEAAGDTLRRAHRQVQSGNPLTRLWLAVRGGKEAALRRAEHASRRIVEEGLKKLNPSTPILSRGGNIPPFAERAKWNHLWLVDPLDGEDVFLDGAGEFTVNIALIQDGAPFLGVVHAPVNHTTWYARARKGAFVRQGNAAAAKLEPPHQGIVDMVPTSGSLAFRLCTLAASDLSDWAHNEPSNEACVAAAALIIGSLEHVLETCGSEYPLRFNTPSMEVGCVQMRKISKPVAQESNLHIPAHA